MSKLQVSVLIIAQNAAFSLKRCLDSLTEFQEIVLVDGGSTDDTLAIAAEYPNVKVYQNPWPGFIAQRNFSISKASHPWCLMIDSDEAATAELVNEIRRIIKLPNPKKLYRIVRTEYLEGLAIESGFGKSDYQERLFQTKHIKYTGGNHHQHLIDDVLATVGHPDMADLDRQIRVLHWPNYSHADWVKKLPRFITLVANEKIEKGRQVHVFDVLATMFGTFFQIMWKSRKEGRLGFVIAVQETIYRLGVKIYIYNHQQLAKKDHINFEKKYLG